MSINNEVKDAQGEDKEKKTGGDSGQNANEKDSKTATDGVKIGESANDLARSYFQTEELYNQICNPITVMKNACDTNLIWYSLTGNSSELDLKTNIAIDDANLSEEQKKKIDEYAKKVSEEHKGSDYSFTATRNKKGKLTLPYYALVKVADQVAIECGKDDTMQISNALLKSMNKTRSSKGKPKQIIGMLMIVVGLISTCLSVTGLVIGTVPILTYIGFGIAGLSAMYLAYTRISNLLKGSKYYGQQDKINKMVDECKENMQKIKEKNGKSINESSEKKTQTTEDTKKIEEKKDEPKLPVQSPITDLDNANEKKKVDSMKEPPSTSPVDINNILNNGKNSPNVDINNKYSEKDDGQKGLLKKDGNVNNKKQEEEKEDNDSNNKESDLNKSVNNPLNSDPLSQFDPNMFSDKNTNNNNENNFKEDKTGKDGLLNNLMSSNKKFESDTLDKQKREKLDYDNIDSASMAPRCDMEMDDNELNRDEGNFNSDINSNQLKQKSNQENVTESRITDILKTPSEEKNIKGHINKNIPTNLNKRTKNKNYKQRPNSVDSKQKKNNNYEQKNRILSLNEASTANISAFNNV